MTNEDMMADFLNWESPETKKPTIQDVPASQLDIIPITPEKPIRKDEKPAPTYINPQRPEPTIQTPEVIRFEDVPVPILTSPLSPEYRALNQLSDKHKPIFNGTVVEVKDRDTKELQELIFALEEKIEKIKVQKWAVQITLEGKMSFVSVEEKKRLREAHSEFYTQRKERGASKAKASTSAAKTAAKSQSAFEKGIQSMVKMHMDEATIRKVLKDAGSPIPENLTAIITSFLMGGK